MPVDLRGNTKLTFREESNHSGVSDRVANAVYHENTEDVMNR